MPSFLINGQTIEIDVEPEMPTRRGVVHVDHIIGKHVEKRNDIRPTIGTDGGDPPAIGARDELAGFCFRKYPVLPSQLGRAHGSMLAEEP